MNPLPQKQKYHILFFSQHIYPCIDVIVFKIITQSDNNIFCKNHQPIKSIWRLSPWRQNSNIPFQTGTQLISTHEVSLHWTKLGL